MPTIKYIGDIITDVRRDTRNEDVPSSTSNVGIETDDFLRYANYAQEALQALIIAAKATVFRTSEDISIESGTQAYTITDNVYMGEHILAVYYSPTGQERDFYAIPERGLGYRNNESGSPSWYFRMGGSLYLCPIPNSSVGTLRVVYERQLDKLDIRRGTISSHSLSGGTLSSLVLSTTGDDADALALAQYLCVNDAFGNVTMYNIPITSYDSTTGIVTVDSSFEAQDGESITDGDYVTIGAYTTTHSKLRYECQRYIETYVAEKIFRRDSSDDAKEMAKEVSSIGSQIMQMYQETPRDDADIQISNPGLLLDFQ